VIGTSIGPYRVVSLLGEGGMGEVYRARDSRLNRDVALKVVPAVLAHDAQRMSRFTREAQVLASMNHPRIASIYGVEEGALVMELVEGPTLGEHMAAGPLPLDEALTLAGQVAEALEYAHEHGIVHRDLKPANIKLTEDGAVKVLDFGLAKALGEPGNDSAASVANSPTLSVHATEAGLILGTAAYMAPEQARGAKVDRRADIWSFGVVLYEMVTGRRLFSGATVGDVLAAVLRDDISYAGVPPRCVRLLQRCLERDPKQRLRDIGDWRLLVDDRTATEAVVAVRPRSSRWWAIATALLTCSTAGLGWAAWQMSRPVPRPLIRVDVDLGPDLVGRTASSPDVGDLSLATVSPDGTRLVFSVRTREGGRQLATRLLEQDGVSLIAGTEGGSDPFFSPDGQLVAFVADNRLKRVPVQGGAVVTVCPIPSATDWQGGAWGDDGNIVAGLQFSGGLSRIPSSGGTPVPITELKGSEGTHRWPQVLPGSRVVVFTALPSMSGGFETGSVVAQSLLTGERKRLVETGYFGRYLTTGRRTGHLVYLNAGGIVAARFDPERLELLGAPVRVVEGVGRQVGFSASANGTVIFPPSSLARQKWIISSLDRAGTLHPIVSTPGRYYTPRLSPDGQRLAFAALTNNGSDIYVYDVQRETMARLTFDEKENAAPVWTPDGRHLVFRTSAGSQRGLRWIRADGAGDVVKLLPGDVLTVPYSFSSDGRRLAYFTLVEGRWQIKTLTLDATDPQHPRVGEPQIFAASPFRQYTPSLSPDGHWMAYRSDESGRGEVYVRPFPGPGGKWQISVGGGTLPTWTRGGREVVFLGPDDRLQVSEVKVAGDSIEVTRPRPFSDVPIFWPGRSNFDITGDGTRAIVFPVPDGSGGGGGLRVTMLLNFLDELRKH